jgi:hypothetical protein
MPLSLARNTWGATDDFVPESVPILKGKKSLVLLAWELASTGRVEIHSNRIQAPAKIFGGQNESK